LIFNGKCNKVTVVDQLKMSNHICACLIAEQQFNIISGI